MATEKNEVMEHLKPLVVKVIEKTIESEGYNHTRVGEWESKIIEESMKQLVEFSSSYKYILACTMIQKSGSGFHVMASCHWDNTKDVAETIRWENSSLICLLNIFAIPL